MLPVGGWVQQTFLDEGEIPGPLPPLLPPLKRQRTRKKMKSHCCWLAVEVWAGGLPRAASPLMGGRCCLPALLGRSQAPTRPRAWRRRGL